MAQRVIESRPIGEFLTNRQKLVVMGSLMIAMFISALDQSIVATATPHILADLGGFKLISWVFTIYLLASTVTVPLVGKLSDMFGRKPFLISGILVFVAASAACGAAPNMLALIIARAVQGIGGGILFGSVFATLGDLFTPLERARFMGYFIGAFTLASLVGPTAGGFLTDGPGWRWCFYINLPVGAIATVAVWKNLPFTMKGGNIRDIDFLGSALLSAATICILLGLVWSHTEFGWGSPETVGLFAAGLVLTVAFLFQESRHPQAIFPLHIFKNRTFVMANLLVVIQGGGMFGAITYLPTFVQIALGRSATDSGLVSTPQSIGLLMTSFIGGQLVSRTGKFKLQVIAGSAVSLAATMLMQTLHVGTPAWHISVFMFIFGLGGGLVGPTISVIVQSSVPQSLMGVATSSRQFFMQIGQVMGVAIFGLVFTTTYGSAFTSNISADTAATLRQANATEQFHDPTLALDERGLAKVRAELASQPDGAAALTDATNAQKDAVSTATTRLFLGSTLAGILVLVVAVAMHEIPLRRSFSQEPGQEHAVPVMEPEMV
ncbi:MAG: MDR family MFS transporter [Dehalococcoidia bacterium]|jgi:EmrB/QacA subfamily drug resistance transporter